MIYMPASNLNRLVDGTSILFKSRDGKILNNVVYADTEQHYYITATLPTSLTPLHQRRIIYTAINERFTLIDKNTGVEIHCE